MSKLFASNLESTGYWYVSSKRVSTIGLRFSRKSINELGVGFGVSLPVAYLDYLNTVEEQAQQLAAHKAEEARIVELITLKEAGQSIPPPLNCEVSLGGPDHKAPTKWSFWKFVLC